MMPSHQAIAQPSAWVQRFASALPAGARVLDLACGGGRHARWLAARGAVVLAVDRDAAVLENLRGLSNIIVRQADLETADSGSAGRDALAGLEFNRFDLIVVTNYLHRPLLPNIVAAVAAGGMLLYETFAVGNEAYGKPSRADFLLREGELLEAVAGHLQVVAYEHGFTSTPKAAQVQRICAVRAGANVALDPL